MTTPATLDRRPLVTAGLVLGLGMGGFVDGIVFHQLLQTHNMLSARREPNSVCHDSDLTSLPAGDVRSGTVACSLTIKAGCPCPGKSIDPAPSRDERGWVFPPDPDPS